VPSLCKARTPRPPRKQTPAPADRRPVPRNRPSKRQGRPLVTRSARTRIVGRIGCWHRSSRRLSREPRAPMARAQSSRQASSPSPALARPGLAPEAVCALAQPVRRPHRPTTVGRHDATGRSGVRQRLAAGRLTGSTASQCRTRRTISTSRPWIRLRRRRALVEAQSQGQ
jgi:hypothetical protein